MRIWDRPGPEGVCRSNLEGCRATRGMLRVYSYIHNYKTRAHKYKEVGS